MSIMNMPGLTAEASLGTPSGHYRSGRPSAARSNAVVPAIPLCQNCDYILSNCEMNGWRPAGLCNMCLSGWCYEEPPMPDPYPDPFGRLPRF